MTPIISREMIQQKARAAYLRGKPENPFREDSEAHKTWAWEIATLNLLKNAMTHQPHEGVAA